MADLTLADVTALERLVNLCDVLQGTVLLRVEYDANEEDDGGGPLAWRVSLQDAAATTCCTCSARTLAEACAEAYTVAREVSVGRVGPLAAAPARLLPRSLPPQVAALAERLLRCLIDAEPYESNGYYAKSAADAMGVAPADYDAIRGDDEPTGEARQHDDEIDAIDRAASAPFNCPHGDARYREDGKV